MSPRSVVAAAAAKLLLRGEGAGRERAARRAGTSRAEPGRAGRGARQEAAGPRAARLSSRGTPGLPWTPVSASARGGGDEAGPGGGGVQAAEAAGLPGPARRGRRLADALPSVLGWCLGGQGTVLSPRRLCLCVAPPSEPLRAVPFPPPSPPPSFSFSLEAAALAWGLSPCFTSGAAHRRPWHNCPGKAVRALSHPQR